MTKEIRPYKTKLDSGHAYWMAKISQVIYLKTSNEDQLPDANGILEALRSEDPSFINVYPEDNNSAQGAVIEHSEYLCIAFRGTNEPEDWLDNVNAFSTKQLFGSFHRGFWNSVSDIWDNLNKTVKRLQETKSRPVFFTGHSLGGAMATIAAAKYIQEDIPFTGVYTFGQPRAMDKETCLTFNSECKDRFFRFHNNNDIVTRVPARLMGYSHVGSYFYITEEKEIHQEPGFWFKFVDYVDGAVESLKEKGFDGIEDHDIADYLEAVKKWDYRD